MHHRFFLYASSVVLGGVFLAGWLMWARSSPAQVNVSPAVRQYEEGRRLAQAGMEGDALMKWQLAITLDPSYSEPYLAAFETFQHKDRNDLAAEILERLSRANPRSPHVQCRLADAYFQAGRNIKAYKVAQKAAHDEPECSLAHTMSGVVRGYLGDTQAAIKELEIAHRLKPAEERISLTLAQFLGTMRRYEEAERIVRNVLSERRDSVQGHYLMGWIKANAPRGSASEAIAEFKQALKLNPEHGLSLAELGSLCVKSKQWKDAKLLLDQAVSIRPADTSVLKNLAATYTALGDKRAVEVRKALERLQRSSDQRRKLYLRYTANPEDEHVLVELSEMEYENGNTEEAFALAREVLLHNPDEARALAVLKRMIIIPGARRSQSPDRTPRATAMKRQSSG